MAVKHVVAYYNDICEQYKQLQDELQDFQKEVDNGVVEPERIENLKKVIEPLKNNYMTISWIMYLLNKPQRDSKEKEYEKRTRKFTESLEKRFNMESIKLENDRVLDKIGGL